MKRKRILYYLIVILLVFPLGELAARVMGYKGVERGHYVLTSSPKNCMSPDSLLGFRLNEGTYTVTINTKLSYSVRHTKEGVRTIGSAYTASPNIGFFGCSFTYGMGVNDTLTFASIVQQRLASRTIINYAVPGYGTIQGLLQLERLIERDSHPDTAIFCFSKLHFDRNALTPSYRKDLKIGYSMADKSLGTSMENAAFPYFSEGKLKHEAWSDLYTNWPFRDRSALMNYMNCLLDKSRTNKINTYAETKSIFDAIIKRCSENAITLMVLFLDDSKENEKLENWLNKHGVRTARAHWGIEKINETNHPYDDHMNPSAHKRIATIVLQEFLNE